MNSFEKNKEIKAEKPECYLMKQMKANKSGFNFFCSSAQVLVIFSALKIQCMYHTMF